MKISQHFSLNKTQYELDFIDIDTDKDTPLFLDPYYISKCDFPFAREAHNSLRTFFEYLLLLLKNNKIQKAKEIFSYLGESNDICLGMSKGHPEGKGMGPTDAIKIFEQLKDSKALASGIMEDIEDLRLFVPNIDKDKVSDMTANIVRKQLLKYTHEQCELLGIPLQDNVPSGNYWNSKTLQWEQEYTYRLIVNEKPILLVPKRIVTFSSKYTSSDYRQHCVLNFLQSNHLKINSNLVQKRNNGDRFVTKKSIKEREGKMGKDYLLNFSLKYPEIFKDYKKSEIIDSQIMEGCVLSSITKSEICNTLKDRLLLIKPGQNNASDYHSLMIGILEFLCYPNLSSPYKEHEIHQGRKRIDIAFENTSNSGFFWQVQTHTKLSAPRIYVECKNYTQDLRNPELDQLSGRFSPQRGRIGILVCRSFTNKDLFIERCADTYNDNRGLIVPIVDQDIIEALNGIIYEEEEGITSNELVFEKILDKRYREILNFS